MGANYTDVWLLLGDNAYDGGLDNEYQARFFDIYKNKLLKQTVLWPAPGNHDYNNSGTKAKDHAIPYYDMFTLPKAAEAGGVASGTEAYYSFNYANIHFVSLDSYGKEANTYKLYDTLGPQVVWLKKDLAANTQKWTILYWHHPPYSMGSHNSDTESELYNIRQNLLKILERYKVDMILCGHSHNYERSKLMKGHYGNEASFNAASFNLSSSSGKYDGSGSSCPYAKNSATSYNGTVYVVAGSSGQLSPNMQASYPHAAMYYSDNSTGGSLALEIEANRLDAKWVCADGSIRDKFTIVKDVSIKKNISIVKGTSAVLTASWIGSYNWTGGAVTRSITAAPTATTTYIVKDGLSCLADTFTVTVTLTRPFIAKPTSTEQNNGNTALKIYPNPTSGSTMIEYAVPVAGAVSLEVFDGAGKKIKSLLRQTKNTGTHTYVFNTANDQLKAGVYSVRFFSIGQQVTQRFIVLPK
jgi:acid phosphatase type 7